MRLLAVDCAMDACQVAILDGETLITRSEAMRKGHAERVADMASEVMAQAGLAFAALDRIAVTTGPGSFAGVRVGLAFARGLAVALDRPCLGFSTLEVLARAQSEMGWRAGVIAAPDGVFLGVWQDGKEWAAPARLPLEAAMAALPEGCVLVGPGAMLLGAASDLATPPIDALARLARLADPSDRPADPLYLRPPYATLPDA